jgi:putative DNA primase/helicase
MTTDALLAKHGIKLPSTAPGRYYVTCPKCSATRSRAHQGSKVLGVTIEADGSVRWGCNHCTWSGPEKGGGERQERRELPSHIYRDKDGVVRFRKVRNLPGREPRFWLERADGRGGWIRGTKGVDTKILYRFDEVAKAITDGRIVLIAEGEKDVDGLVALGFAGSCNAHGASESGKAPKWTKTHSEQLRGADIVVLNDNDAAGYAHADTTCKLSLGIAKRVRRLDLAKHWPEIPKGGDVSDWLAAGHTSEELETLIASAPDYAPTEESQGESQESSAADAEIARLAKLSISEYEREREAAAKKLKFRASILDKVVAAERERLNPNGGKPGQGQPIEFPEPEPWPDPVNGAILLDGIATAVRRHVVMSDRERDICALWALYTHLIDRFLVAPRLAIRSPTPECGKTTLLSVLQHLVPKPLRTSSVTAAVTFRVIAMCQPTLLIDEAKNIADKADLLEVLNDGHHRGGRTLRNVPIGDGYEPRAFATFAALAVALIGSLPAELHGRSLVIDLKRRRPGDEITEIRVGRTEHLDTLARKAVRWAADNAMRIAAMEPAMPVGIYSRAADNWKPLLAIADAAGGEWPQRARDAASKSHAAADVDDASMGELLLADIRDVFASEGEAPVADMFAAKVDVEISSADLVKGLIALEGRPWAELGKARKPLTTNGLARRLKPLGIAPGMTGPESARQRGYKLAAFEEAFSRYLPSEGVSNRTSVQNAANTGTSDDFKVYSRDDGCTVEKCEKPNNDGPLYTCTVAKGGNGGNGDARTSSPFDDGVGLSAWRIRQLAEQYQDRAYANAQANDGDTRTAECDAWLRQTLAEGGVPPEFIKVEFRRVIDEVFRI